MKRDMDLCREILRQVEASPRSWGKVAITIEGRSEEEIGYHVKLLAQAGLIEEPILVGVMQLPTSLTWAGHEFLDATRDDTLWNKAKATVASTTGGLAFEFLQAWLKREAAQRLGIEL